MDRENLLDNLVISRDKRELVTLALSPIRIYPAGIVVTGRIIAVAEHYTGRSTTQVVLDRAGQSTLVIGMTMIRDFHVGPRRAEDATEREIHPTHDPEPDGQRIYSAGGGGRACRRCCKFVSFEGATYRITESGAAPCTPARVELR